MSLLVVIPLALLLLWLASRGIGVAQDSRETRASATDHSGRFDAGAAD
jgi:hypothetical protein